MGGVVVAKGTSEKKERNVGVKQVQLLSFLVIRSPTSRATSRPRLCLGVGAWFLAIVPELCPPMASHSITLVGT